MDSKIKDFIFKIWVALSSTYVILTALLILGFILTKGIGSLNIEFLTSSPQGMPLGSEGGILPAILGSLALGVLSSFFAIIMGISTAIYLGLYCHSVKIYNLIKIIIQAIAGIPSIILGLFGYAVFVVYMGMGYSLLAGSLTLSLMIFPVVTINTEKALNEIQREQILSSYALGISKSYTFFAIIWPTKKKEILSGIIIGTTYAMGATAPIMMTAAVLSASSPSSFFKPIMALPYHLYILSSENISKENAYGTALTLMLIFFIGYFFTFLLIKNREEDDL